MTRSKKPSKARVEAVQAPKPRMRGKIWLALLAGLFCYGLDHYFLEPIYEQSLERYYRAEEIERRTASMRQKLPKLMALAPKGISDKELQKLADWEFKAGRKAQARQLAEALEIKGFLAQHPETREELVRAVQEAEKARDAALHNRSLLLVGASLVLGIWLLAAAWLSRAALGPLVLGLLKLALWIPKFLLQILAALLGSGALNENAGAWTLDRGRLKTHLWRSFWVAALLLSFGGLFMARTPLLSSGRFFWPLFWAALGLGSLLRFAVLCWRREGGQPGFRALPQLLLTTLATAAALFAGYYLAGIAWDLSGRVALSRARAAFEKDGHSLSLPEPEKKVAPEHNAATYYRKAVEAEWALTTTAKKWDVNSKDNDVLTKLLSQASRNEPFGTTRAAAVAVLARHAQTLKHAKEAASRTEFAWGIELKRPYYNTEIPPFGPSMTCVRLLAAEAVLAAEAGRMGQALDSLEQGFRFTRALNDGRTLISQMVAIAEYGMLFKSASYVLNRPGTRADAAPWKGLNPGSLAAGVRQRINREAVVHWMDAEYLGNCFYTLEQLPGELGSYATYAYAPFIRLDASTSRPLWSKLLGAMDGSEPPKPSPDLDGEFSRAWLLTAMSMPKFSEMHKKGLKADAWFRIAEAAARARAFKAKKGRWPDGAWELASAISKDMSSLRDPFSGGWLKIMRTHEGIAIYSVGIDGLDDQGAPTEATWEIEKGDLAWMLK